MEFLRGIIGILRHLVGGGRNSRCSNILLGHRLFDYWFGRNADLDRLDELTRKILLAISRRLSSPC
jgi:hypothetical protein